MASGVYFYELAMNKKVERRKMTLVRNIKKCVLKKGGLWPPFFVFGSYKNFL